MSKWRDISTAPTDGSYFLAAVADEDWGTECNPLIVQWVSNGWSGGRNWRIQLDGQCVLPTHWMPLPHPPSDRTG